MTTPDEQARLDANRTMWDERVPLHVVADLYDVPGFRAGANTLPDLEVQELGDVTGRSLLHLQCHFGLDTLSWARLGATVTGLDFSGEAIATARELGLGGRHRGGFRRGECFRRAGGARRRSADVSSTSSTRPQGVLGWLPDVDRWARAAAACVRPGGVFYIREFHHVAWIFDDAEGVEELQRGVSLL